MLAVVPTIDIEVYIVVIASCWMELCIMHPMSFSMCCLPMQHTTDTMSPFPGSVSAHSLHWVEDWSLQIACRTTQIMGLEFGSAPRRLTREPFRLLKTSLHVPQAPAAQPVLLDNAHMLKTGQSLSFILHPSLPICIMGYKYRTPAVLA